MISVFFAPNYLYAEEAEITNIVNNNCLDLKKSLRYRMRDILDKKDIWNLQNFLKNENLFNVSPTGYFGTITLKSVKSFQKKYNINPIGIVGPLTRAKILEISCASIDNSSDSNINTQTPNTDFPVNNTNTSTDTTTTTETSITTPETVVDEILTAPNNSSLKVRTEGLVSSTNNSATLRGNITAGARSATKAWIEITKNPSVYKKSETTQGIRINQPSNVKFEQTFSSLSSNTTYYYRACAENLDLGQKSCGNTSYFTTSN